MSLFQCEVCGCCENTAYSSQGFAPLKESFNWDYAPMRCGMKLCSACGPARYITGNPTETAGKWHGRFERVFLPRGAFITNRLGNLEHRITGSVDYRAYAVEPYIPPRGWCLVPAHPDYLHLESVARRLRTDFDTMPHPEQIALLNEIRTLYEETTGQGQYQVTPPLVTEVEFPTVPATDVEPHPSAARVPPHRFTEAVNDIMVAVRRYGSAQQLRARLVDALKVIAIPDHTHLRSKPDAYLDLVGNAMSVTDFDSEEEFREIAKQEGWTPLYR